jgi:hypothetical protein
MARQKRGRVRKMPHQLKTVAFDTYIYAGKPGKHGGTIICRNTKTHLKFNNWLAEEQKILNWMAMQHRLVRGVAL